jgi:hypothetical protein
MAATDRDHEAAREALELARSLDVPLEDLTAREFRAAGHTVSNGRWGLTKRLASALDEQDAATPHGHHVKGVSTLTKDAHGRLTWIKTDRDKEAREAALRAALESLPESMPKRRRAVTPPKKSASADLLAAYPMGDPHVGLLAWGEETGGESWDLRKAEAVMGAAIDDLASHAPRTEEAIIVQLGDYYHSDNTAGVTARSGHSLDVDGRWARVLRVGVRVMVATIDAVLRAHQRVRVVNAIGNHDDHSSVFLSVGLDAYYRNEPRVEIDLSPAMHRYHRFGSVLLGITHGHTSKKSDLESIMACDRPEDWGETSHRHWLTGHVHHTTRQEYRGCVVETFRTLAPRDAWHAAEGYRSGRDMHRIVYHREHGEVARSLVSAGYLRTCLEGAA